MSGKLAAEDVLFLQRLLKGAGFYGGALDGQWGPKTDAAVKAFEGRGRELRQVHGELDSRSEANLRLLHPKAQEAAQVGLVDGLEWGGNWTSLQDWPHYQLATGLSISDVREKFEKGEPVV